ncbi:lupus La protein [Gadus macrocephalus]|uniref:lupus La protein n=1 Tax=Gadus macrocephalus TaxID=80720 RepID=UPI0028CB8494|nr:lupus La protein [Gadus macrocephalus]
MADMTPTEGKVVRQIEYYFGDHNLPRDKFLKEQLQLDDGWVKVATMLQFNRLKSLTTDSAVIIEALLKSKTGLLEISEDKTKIRRSAEKPIPEINEDYKDAMKNKSVYIKGFPLETTLDEILEWTTGKGQAENIQMRRNLQRQFKGSVFLCFDTEEAAKAFLGREDIKSFKDNELLVLSREAYHAKKAEDRKQHKAESKAKAKHNKDETEKQTEEKEMGLLLEEQTGCLLKFSGELDQVSREDFHALFSGHGKIKWVDFTRGAKEGTLLFDGKAKEALDKATEANGGTLQIKENDVAWELLEGDVEKEVLKKMIQAQQESYTRTKGRGREKFGGRGGGRGGGRRGGRGRGGRDQNRSHFQGKKTKFEDDNGDDGPPSPKKRAREDASADAPEAKVTKTENGS